MHTILIVDDDPTLRLLVSLTLDRPDFEVIEAFDGDDALRVLGERSVDLVVLDWMMPGLSGLEVARHLRSQPETALIPIVMLTAKTQQSDICQASVIGVWSYMVKPFSPAELLKTVEKALVPERTASSKHTSAFSSLTADPVEPGKLVPCETSLLRVAPRAVGIETGR